MNWPSTAVIGMAVMLTRLAASQPTNAPNPYQLIVDRNAFGLRVPVAVPKVDPLPEPLEDLVLNGLIEIGACREALFSLIEPGKPPSLFILREGEQNQWLEIKAINSRDGRVTVVLKKPVARSRAVGVEVELSFQADGHKGRTVALNKGNPHVDVPEQRP